MVETIGVLILGAEIAGISLFGAVTVGTVVGASVLLAGTIGLQMLLRPPIPGSGPTTAPSIPTPDSGHQVIRQAIPSRITGYGTSVRLGGAYVLFEEDSGTSYDVVAFHHGEVSAISGYYLHDDVVEINGSGIVQALGDGRYAGSVITIKTRLGLPTETAYSEVTTPLSTIWTSAHRGDGIASLALICAPTASVEDFHNVYPRGKPEPSVVADLRAILDIRTGDVLVTNNPVLQLIDFLTNTDYGMGLPYATLITPVLADLIVEADLCDDAIELDAGGDEKRYESHGTFPLDSDPVNIINTILDTCDGWISENGDGSLALKVGVYRAPSITITEDHIRGFSLQKGVADEELVNEITFDYTSPLADYKTVPGQPWRDEASISELGKVRSQRLALPWVYSHSQGRRLSKRRTAQLNPTMQGTLTTTLYGLTILGERWIRIHAPLVLADFTYLVVEVRGVTIDLATAQVTIKFVTVNPNTIDAWDPATEEGSAPEIPSKLVFPPPPVPQNIDARPANEGVEGEGGGHHGSDSTFFIMYDDLGRSDLQFECAWRINGTADAFTIDPRVTPVFQPGFGRWSAAGGFGISAFGTYEVKVRTFAPAGAGSSYSSTDTVTITSF